MANYDVTIDVTTVPISYSYTDEKSGELQSAYRLPVAGKDTVSWRVKIADSNPHCLTIVFTSATPLADAENGRPVFTVLGTESEGTGGEINALIDAEASGTFEYNVVVFDRKTKKRYMDDPRIIVGTGGITAAAQIREVLRELKGIERSDPTLTKKINSIKRRLENVINELE